MWWTPLPPPIPRDPRVDEGVCTQSHTCAMQVSGACSIALPQGSRICAFGGYPLLFQGRYMLGYNPIQIYGHMLRSHYILPHIYTQEQNLRCSRWVVILISCVKPTHFDQYSTLAVLDSLWCGQIDLHNETFWKTQSKVVETFNAANRNETKYLDMIDFEIFAKRTCS